MKSFLKPNIQAQITDDLFMDREDSITKRRIESDREFLERLITLKEKTQMLEKYFFSKRPELTEQQFQMIEKAGDFHYDCQVINSNSSLNPLEVEQQIKCKCGCRKSKGQPLPYCLNIEQTFFFGPGILLFFYFCKRLSFLVLLSILIYGLYALISNIIVVDNDLNCFKDPGELPFLCNWQKIVRLPSGGKNKQLLTIQTWLAVPMALMWAIGIRFIRDIGRVMNEKIKEKLESSSDLCILLQDLPPGEYSEPDIISYMNKLWNMRKDKTHSKLKIKSVQILYKSHEIRSLMTEIREVGIDLCQMFEEVEAEEQKQHQKQQQQDQKDKQQNDVDPNKETVNKIVDKHQQQIEKVVFESLRNQKSSRKISEEIPSTRHIPKNIILWPLKKKRDPMSQRLYRQQRKIKHQKKKKIEHISNKIVYKVEEEYLEDYKEGKQRLVELCKELERIREEFINNREFRKQISSETVLVEFVDKSQQLQFLQNYGKYQESQFKKFKNKLQSCCQEDESKGLNFKGNNVSFYRAPEPSDINWMNAEKTENNFRIFLIWVINILLICLTFGALMLFRYLSSISPTLAQASFIKIIIINLLNRLIWNILNMVINFEENKTKAESIVSVMNKSYLAQSCNIIVLPMIMKLVFGKGSRAEELRNLGSTVHDYQVTAFLFMTLFNFVNFPFLLHRLFMFFKCTRRLLIHYYLRLSSELKSIQQIQELLKQLYEPPNLPVSGIYVYITTITNQAFFFCHAQPVLLFYLLFNLIFFYFINKYLLLRRCKIPDLLNFFLFETVIIFAMNIPLFYGVGSLVIMHLVNPHPPAQIILPSIIVLLIWFLSFQNPFGLFQRFIKWLQFQIWGEQFGELSSESNAEPEESLENIESEIKSEANEEEVTNVRRENYYKNSPISDLFNFENKLTDLRGPYHNKFKNFCRKFNFNIRRKNYQMAE